MQGTLKIHETPPADIKERAVWWSFIISEWLAKNEAVLETLPDNATLVILPDDDSELVQHNLNLTRHVEGAQVLVRLERVGDSFRVLPFLPTVAGTMQAGV